MPILTYRPDIALGVAARDVVTGRTGRITGVLRRLTGNDEVLLEPMASGTPTEPFWCLVGRTAVMPQVAGLPPLPGPVPPYALQDTPIGNPAGPGRAVVTGGGA